MEFLVGPKTTGVGYVHGFIDKTEGGGKWTNRQGSHVIGEEDLEKNNRQRDAHLFVVEYEKDNSSTKARHSTICTHHRLCAHVVSMIFGHLIHVLHLKRHNKTKKKRTKEKSWEES